MQRRGLTWLLNHLAEAGNTSLDYHLFEESELSDWLCKFWFVARKKDGEMYTVNSLKSFKYAISHHLKPEESWTYL